MTDLELLIRDKYDGDAARVTEEDMARLAAGEPLAYVIGWTPFLGLRIGLESKPLIPRPETEWWTQELTTHLRKRFGNDEFRLLDLCAGSGAIGIAVLKEFPNARVWFGELMPEHCEQIRKNLELNGIDPMRADVRESHLFESFTREIQHMSQFDIIAANPPYIPEGRELEASVSAYEPYEALFARKGGLELIDKIALASEDYLYPNGEVWMECDVTNIQAAKEMLDRTGASESVILNDQYGRPRVVVAYFR